MLATARLQTIVCATDIDRAEGFYRGQLGLPLKARSLAALVFDAGGSDLRIAPVRGFVATERTVVGFAVTDAAATMDALAAAGVDFAPVGGYAFDRHGLITAPDGTRVGWIRDPDGNLISIVQYVSGGA